MGQQTRFPNIFVLFVTYFSQTLPSFDYLFLLKFSHNPVDTCLGQVYVNESILAVEKDNLTIFVTHGAIFNFLPLHHVWTNILQQCPSSIFPLRLANAYIE